MSKLMYNALEREGQICWIETSASFGKLKIMGFRVLGEGILKWEGKISKLKLCNVPKRQLKIQKNSTIKF
jgi:hypothetical protein